MIFFASDLGPIISVVYEGLLMYSSALGQEGSDRVAINQIAGWVFSYYIT